MALYHYAAATWKFWSFRSGAQVRISDAGLQASAGLGMQDMYLVGSLAYTPNPKRSELTQKGDDWAKTPMKMQQPDTSLCY